MNPSPDPVFIPLERSIPAETPSPSEGQEGSQANSAPSIPELKEWKTVVACADSFAAAAKRVQGLVFKNLAFGILAWGAGVTVYWEAGGTLLLVLGGVMLIPLLVLSGCGYMLSSAKQFPRVVAEAGVALDQVQAARRTDFLAAIRTDRWKGLLPTLRGGRKLWQSLRTLYQVGEDAPTLLGSAVALCSPLFWLALAVALPAAGAQSVIIAMAVLLGVLG